MYLSIKKSASLVLTGTAVVVQILTLTSKAATLYSTGFENPPMASGSNLIGQDGWIVGAPFLSPAAPLITNTAFVTGTQSLRVRGQDMVSAVEVTPEYDAVGSYRRPVNYDTAAAGTPVVTISASVRLDGSAATGDFFAANIGARSGDGGIGEMGISSDGFVYGYTGNFGSATLFSTPVTLGAWHSLSLTINFNTNSYSFGVDGTSSGSFPFEAGFTSDVLVRGAIVTYAKADAGAMLRGNYNAFFDNFAINTVPEPSMAGLLLVTAAGVVARRRHQAGR